MLCVCVVLLLYTCQSTFIECVGIFDLEQVKDKMLYAATKATLKKEFSQGVIVDDIAATHKVSLQ